MSPSKYFSTLLLLPLLAMPLDALADPVYASSFLPIDFHAAALNRHGQVSGVGRQDIGEPRGFLYAGGSFTGMGSFGNGLSVANAINGGGQLAGFASVSNEQWWDPERHAAVFHNGVLADLGTLGGRSSEASDLNDAGLVAGWSETADGVSERPFLFTPGGAGMTDLGSLGGAAGRANGINNAGTVVGLSDIGGLDGFDYHAFVYGSGGMADLNGLVALDDGWTLTTALDVNDAGQILAQACNESLATCRAVRLDLVSAVPEPGGWAMLAAGLVLLLWRARRRTLWIAAAPLLAAPLASAQALPQYAPTFLPAGFTAMAINASGHVAGNNGSVALWNGSTLVDYAAVAPGSLAMGLDNRGHLPASGKAMPISSLRGRCATWPVTACGMSASRLPSTTWGRSRARAPGSAASARAASCWPTACCA